MGIILISATAQYMEHILCKLCLDRGLLFRLLGGNRKHLCLVSHNELFLVPQRAVKPVLGCFHRDRHLEKNVCQRIDLHSVVLKKFYKFRFFYFKIKHCTMVAYQT